MNGTLLVGLAAGLMSSSVVVSIFALNFGWRRTDVYALTIFPIGAVILAIGIYLGGWPGFGESITNVLGPNWPMMGW